jgi:2-oxoglutarate dehydrogenase E1 component
MPSQLLLGTATRRLVAAARRPLVNAASATTFARSAPAKLSLFSTLPDLKNEKETFLTGTSSLYAEQMYEQYVQDPTSVHPSWKQYFDNIEGGIPYDESLYQKPTALASSKQVSIASVSTVVVVVVVCYRLLDCCKILRKRL